MDIPGGTVILRRVKAFHFGVHDFDTPYGTGEKSRA